jgi:hypothetical protein
MTRKQFLRYTPRLDNPPRLLDLFAGDGGAARGYRDAGFEVVGVDLRRDHSYPFHCYRADALTFEIEGFDAVHASPPCAPYSYIARGRSRQPALIAEIRERIRHLPYVIENVQGARDHMIDPVMLCGSSFGLDVRRHRLFETNWPLPSLPCRHRWQTADRFTAPDFGSGERPAHVVGVYGSTTGPEDIELKRKAMEIHWTSGKGLTQAIPPAYTRFVGQHLISYLRQKKEESA